MSKPNIIMILADDMGYGDLGALGDGHPETPALDRLAEQGILLTSHYSASPVCTPARAALLTGRYPHRTGAIDMREVRGLSRLSLKERTIADWLKAEGYATGLVGKWHLGTIGSAYHPTSRGFDEFVGFKGGQMDYYDWRLFFQDELRSSDGTYVTDVFGQECVRFIRKHAHEPFFLHAAFNAPHTPLQAPAEEIRHFLDKGLPEDTAAVYAMIRRMDAAIGAIVEEVRAQGLEDNTIIWFSSDNGPQGKRFNGGLSGNKGRVYEGGIRVPCIVRWPKHWEGGKRLDRFVHFTDWLPTLLAAAQIPLPEQYPLDGCDVGPILSGAEAEVEGRRFWQWNRFTPAASCNAAMRDGVWKLVRPPIREAMLTSSEDQAMDRDAERNPEKYPEVTEKPMPERELPPPPPEELYRLDIDPGEQNNVAERYPDRISAMSQALDEWFEEVERDRHRDRI